MDQTKKTKEKTVLVVEDDYSGYSLLKVILDKSQAKVLHARNGKEAIKFSQTHPEICLVLMDIRLPILNGYEATRQIKKIRPALPVIAQTAYAQFGDREKALAAGCDDYIPKPINIEILARLLDKYLKH